MNKKIEKVIMIGMGAVGSTMGLFLQEALQDGFAFLMDDRRKEKYTEYPLLINGMPAPFKIIGPSDGFGKADLILISTKLSGLEDAITLSAPFIGEDTVLMSALNGVSSEDRLREVFPEQDVIRTIAQKMDSRYENGEVTFTKTGELVFGAENDKEEKAADRIQELFDRAGLPYVRSENIVRDQYKKLMANCGINQVCAAYDATYGEVMSDPFLRGLFEKAMNEVLTVANARGIDLKKSDIEEWLDAIDGLDPGSMPSMAQDMKAGRKSELSLFSGTVVPMAEEMGIDTPVLRDLMERIQEKEQAF